MKIKRTLAKVDTLAVLLLVAGCGAATVGEEQRAQFEGKPSDSPIAALDSCPTPFASSLRASTEAPDTMRATLYWNAQNGECWMQSGREVPDDAEPILRFSRRSGEYDVLAVLPWLLRGAGPARIEAGRVIELTAALDDNEVEVEFKFDESDVTVQEVRIP